MKEKRKNRLDKGSSSEFIGFNAFAGVVSTTAPTFGTVDRVAGSGTSAASGPGGGASWTPVYTGSDPAVQKAFSWLTSKRDPTTHVKALRSLQDHVSQPEASKKVQVLAVQHFIWLYHRKIYYDTTPAVRAAALQLWVRIRERLPKAFANLVEPDATATSSTDGTVVLGMLYSTRVDSASEVRQVVEDPKTQEILFAGAYCDNDTQHMNTTTSSETSLVPWEEGLKNFATSILSCGRQSVFYERLLQGKKSTQASLYSLLNDEQKDIVLETYLRVVGNTLDALVLYLRQHPTGRGTSLPDTSVWYKSLASAHASLRGRTYSLVAAVAATSSLPLPNLTMALSSEKEAANWPALLECVLACSQSSSSSSSSSPTEGGKEDRKSIVAAPYVGPLTKAWKRALYGANMATAGPMLLPLTASMPTPNEAWKVLLAAWEGKELSLGSADKWRLVQAVAESLAFGLLRKQKNDDIPAQYTMEWPNLYGTVVVQTLQTDPSNLTGTSIPAYETLIKNLGEQLPRLETALLRTASQEDVPAGNALELLTRQNSAQTMANRLLPIVQQNDGNVVSGMSSRALSELLKHAPKLLSLDASPFIPLFRVVFNNLCPRKASGDVPSYPDYGALRSMLDLVNCRRLFESGTTSSMEKFVLNDLLRWTVIHTSRLANDQTQDKNLVSADFGLLQKCLESLQDMDNKRKLWEPFLKELTAAKCRIEWLQYGMKSLIKHARGSDFDWIRCNVLDDFVRNIENNFEENGDDAISDSSEDTDEEKHVMEFLALCFGLSGESRARLVDSKVVKMLAKESWEAEYSYGSRPSPVERSLLALVTNGTSEMLEESEENQLLLHSWSQGSQTLVDALLVCLKQRRELAPRFILDASSRLKGDIERFNKTAIKDKEVKIWAIRASDLIRVCVIVADDNTPYPSFTLLGLSNLALWESHPKTGFELSMALFEYVKEPPKRLDLLLNSNDVSAPELLVSILLATSEACVDFVRSSRTRRGEDGSAKFLAAIGGSMVDGSLVEGALKDTVRRLENVLHIGEAAKNRVCHHVAVLSQLVGALFRPLNPKSGELSAESIHAGDRLLYILDADQPSALIPAEIVKVHFDSVAGYYYSISVSQEGSRQERQTVLARLRRKLSDDDEDAIHPDVIPKEEVRQRNAIRDLILHRLVLPFFASLSWDSAVSELLNVVVSNVGIGTARGLGTAHYDVFQLLKKESDAVTAASIDSNPVEFEEAAWRLSLALGLGLTVPSCAWISSIFKLDYLSLLESALSISECFAHQTRVVSATLAIISTFLEPANEIKVPSPQMTVGICKLVDTVLRSSKAFSSDSFLAMHALNKALAVATECDDTHAAIEQTISNLVTAFACSWELSEGTPAWCAPVEQTLEILQSKKSWLGLLGNSAAVAAEELTPCLFLSQKRHLAFRMLEVGLDRKVALRDESNISLPSSTEHLVQSWTTGLLPEESEDLIQDVEVVSQWLPLRILTEIEKWGDELFESIDCDESIGRFLMWLIVLRIVDAAAPLDFRNRPAFVSFFRMTEASSSILNRAILFEEYVNGSKCPKSTGSIDPDFRISVAADITVERLSGLVLFRTTEVLPSLCRMWWEKECPKVYLAPVQMLVEKWIAPVILSRELSRVRSSAESFGDMNVSGSSVTRQVSATYVQDDFTLTVLITLPESFPLRSAQVDCSKTLGVQQNRWKRWSLQITQMLNNQGGTLQDALLLWKDNVDKEFEGVEPCPVCYSVLHVKTHKLPSLECNTCHNRFHKECLMQWFSSSGKNQCVLCQQDWRGTKVS